MERQLETKIVTMASRRHLTATPSMPRALGMNEEVLDKLVFSVNPRLDLLEVNRPLQTELQFLEWRPALPKS